LSYPQMAHLAGAQVKLLPSTTQTGFCLDLNSLEAAIGPKTRLLLLNSPGNPTGRVMPYEELEGVAELLRDYPQILVMSDEIYELLLCDGQKHHSFSAVAPDLADRTFIVNGFAKGWAMTGWRLGYLAGPADAIKAATALQSQSTSNVCSFAQRGALAALQGSRQCVNTMASSYSSRREVLTNGLMAIEGVQLVAPQGAFYAFPQLPPGSLDSMSFCKQALENYGLAMVPGAAFGDDSCIRLTCAASHETICDGLERLSKALKKT
ncbi:MAG: aminotransferase class I/II-fold pyridoxal phosphate-dependent enzyme, partial [Prochlorococcus sp.]